MSNTGPIVHVIIAFDTVNAAFRGVGDPEDEDYTDDRWVRNEVGVLLTRMIRMMGEHGLHSDLPLIDGNGAIVGVVTVTREEVPNAGS